MKKKKIIKTMPKEFKPKCITVYDGIFQQTVTVLINYSPTQYQGWLNRNKIKDIGIKDFDNFAGWCTEYEEEGGVIKRVIFLPRFNWTIKEQATLIHEIVHCIIKIWQSNNIPYNADTQEFLAHSIANLYQDIARKLLIIV